MEIKDIKKYFSDTILRRGYDYYRNNKVKEIYKTNDIYTALVKGSEDYQVIIDMTTKDYKMSCNCPYESACKHEAAVLYCLKKNAIPVKEEKFTPAALSPFESFTKDLENSIKTLNRQYNYYNGYDDYDDEELDEDEEKNQYETYVNTIKKYVKRGITEADNDVDYLLKTFKFLLNAITNCQLATLNYSNTDIFPEFFSEYGITLEKKDFFAGVLSMLVDLRLKENNYFYKYLDDAICQNISQKWQAEYLVNYFNDLEEILKEPIFLKLKITYNFLDKNQALQEAKTPKYLSDENVIDWLLEIYKDNPSEKINLLKEFCSQKDNWTLRRYYPILLDLYKENDISKYKEGLLTTFQKDPDYQTYLKIKETLSLAEWNNVKEKIIIFAKENTSLLCYIYLNEQDYPQVLKILKKSPIDFITKFIDDLVTIYPEELLSIYETELIKFIDGSKGTSDYLKVSSYFDYLKKFPNGKEEILNLIEYIRNNYPNRGSFQKEMDFYQDTYL